MSHQQPGASVEVIAPVMRQRNKPSPLPVSPVMATTRELVEQLLQHIGRGDAQAAAGLFSERVDFAIPHDPVVWWIPEVQTREDLAGFFSLMGAELLTESFDVDRIVVDGDDAVILGRMVDTVRKTGKSFTSRFSLRLTRHDGALIRYHFLEDTAAVRDAAQMPAADQ